MVKNLPCNARDMGSIPGQRTKIPHAVGQPSPCATSSEATGHSWREACTLQLRPDATEKNNNINTIKKHCNEQ